MIEQGQEAILAGVIRGNAPQDLRLVFQDALATIHLKYNKKLKEFEGDTNLFLDSQTELKPCLQSQYESPSPNEAQSSKTLPILGLILGATALAIVTWIGLTIRDNLRWSAFLHKLNDEPGIVIVKSEKHWGKYFVSGLRDPLAVDPKRIMQLVKLSPKTVVSQWKPYISLEPALLTARVKKMLRPPTTVSLAVDENGILYARGSASLQWITETRKKVQLIPGINQFQEKRLIGLGLNKHNYSQR